MDVICVRNILLWSTTGQSGEKVQLVTYLPVPETRNAIKSKVMTQLIRYLSKRVDIFPKWLYYQGDKTKDKKKKKNYIIYLSIGISDFCSSIIAKRKREREIVIREKEKNGVL